MANEAALVVSAQHPRLELSVDFTDALRRHVAPFAASAWGFSERLRALDEQAMRFVERHGWPLPLALGIGGIQRIVRLTDRGKREVTAFMVRSFVPRTRAYRVSRDRLLDSEHFASRRQPITQGLHALNRGHYYAAICVLLPLVEGALADVAFPDDAPRVGVPKKSIDKLTEDGDAAAHTLTFAPIEALLVSATTGSALFGGFDRADYGRTGESRRLNRHAILHGAARRYGTHANALKLFLLLVALAETLHIYETEKARDLPAVA